MVNQLIYALIFLQLLTNSAAKVDYQNGFTPTEAHGIKQLKKMVERDLTQNFMKEDIYLIRFLRARNLNLEDAKAMLLKTLNWRKNNKIDTILNETLEVEKFMPFIESMDRIGRPVATVIIGEWKIRHMVLAGRSEEMFRAVYKMIEYSTSAIRKNAMATGKNITQALILFDMNAFTRSEHGCLLCVSVYVELLTTYENYYPYIFNQIVTVNTPRLFQSIYSAIKPVLSKYTQDAILIHGYDKNEWRKHLLEFVSNDQLPLALGGTFVPKHKMITVQAKM